MGNPIKVQVHKEAIIDSADKKVRLHIGNNNMVSFRIKYTESEGYEDTMSFTADQAAELGQMFDAAAREAGFKVKRQARQPAGTAAAAKKAAKK